MAEMIALTLMYVNIYACRRLRLLSLIQAQPNGEACVCHLMAPLGLSQGTVSHHLRVLREAGLVEREQRGSWAYYRVVPDALAALRTVLA